LVPSVLFYMSRCCPFVSETHSLPVMGETGLKVTHEPIRSEELTTFVYRLPSPCAAEAVALVACVTVTSASAVF